MRYEIGLANGDCVSYVSDLPLEDFKKLISNNDFLEIQRNGTEPYGNGGWRRVPKFASYLTKSFVYIEEDVYYDERKKNYDASMKRKKVIVSDILKYIPNRRMKVWLYFDFYTRYKMENDDDWLKIPEDYLLEIKQRFIKYGCKTK